MLFWLTLGLLIIFFILNIIEFVVLESKGKSTDDITFFSFMFIVFLVSFIIELMVIGSSFFDKQATYNIYEQERNSLQYQLDFGVYEPLSSNENFDNSTKINLYNQVEDFNEKLGSYKGHKASAWIGIFYQADLDKIDYIQYPDRESWIDKADGVKKYELNINN